MAVDTRRGFDRVRYFEVGPRANALHCSASTSTVRVRVRVVNSLTSAGNHD